MDRHRSARSLECQQCGSAFEIDRVVPEVTCPSCGHRQRVDPAVLQELRAYRQQVDHRRARITSEQERRDQWEAQFGRMRRGSPLLMLVFFGAITVLPMMAGMGAWLLSFVAGARLERFVPLLGPIMMVGVMVLVVGYVLWTYSGKRREERGEISLKGAALSCPSCGAINKLEAGDDTETCDWCGSALIPSTEAIADRIDHSREAERRARLDRYRAERAGIAKASGYNMGPYVHLLVFGSMGVMISGIALVVTAQMVTGALRFHPGVLVLWLLGIAFFAVMFGITLYKWHNRSRWTRAANTLARQLRGEAGRGIEGVVSWLDAFWAGSYAKRYIHCGPYSVWVQGRLDGFPVFVNLDPRGTGRYHHPKIHLLLAAWVPGVSDGGNQPTATGPHIDGQRHDLKKDGKPKVREAGLVLELRPEWLDRLQKQPERVVELAPLLSRLAHLARDLRADPVGRIG